MKLLRSYYTAFTNDTAAILLLGLLLRLFVAPFTLNWDLIGIVNTAKEFSLNNLSDFYKIPTATYPPLMYALWVKPAMLIADVFSGGKLSAWLGMGAADAFNSPYLFRILLLLKIPTIVGDLVCGFLVSRLVSKIYRRRALIFWVFNPIVIFLTSAWTNVDLPVILVMVVALLLLKRGNKYWAAGVLGLGTSLKLLPAFIAPLFILAGKTMREKILIGAFFLATTLLTQGPALILPQYRNHALTSGYSNQTLFATLAIGPDRYLVIAAFVYILFILQAYSNRTRETHFVYFLIAFLPLFVFSVFGLQWFIWLIPFLVIYQAQIGTTIELILLYLAYSALILLSQSSLNIGMLAPIEPSLWMLAWPLKNKIGGQVYTLLNLAHTALAASLVWISYRWYHAHHNTL